MEYATHCLYFPFTKINNYTALEAKFNESDFLSVFRIPNKISVLENVNFPRGGSIKLLNWCHNYRMM